MDSLILSLWFSKKASGLRQPDFHPRARGQGPREILSSLCSSSRADQITSLCGFTTPQPAWNKPSFSTSHRALLAQALSSLTCLLPVPLLDPSVPSIWLREDHFSSPFSLSTCCSLYLEICPSSIIWLGCLLAFGCQLNVSASERPSLT